MPLQLQPILAPTMVKANFSYRVTCHTPIPSRPFATYPTIPLPILIRTPSEVNNGHLPSFFSLFRQIQKIIKFHQSSTSSILHYTCYLAVFCYSSVCFSAVLTFFMLSPMLFLCYLCSFALHCRLGHFVVAVRHLLFYVDLLVWNKKRV